MRNQAAFFIIFSLIVTVFVVGGYGVFQRHFGQGTEHLARIEKLEKDVAKEKFRNVLLGHQIKDMQQSVAELLPEARQIVDSPDLKNLSDALRAPASESSLDLSGVLFERAKGAFADKRFDEGIRTFRELLDKYPLSRHVVEARFFIVESYFLKRDYKSALVVIEEMMTLYPENDLTGYAMLRMGQISEFNNQLDEAREIYATVQRSFSNSRLQEQSRALMGTAEEITP